MVLGANGDRRRRSTASVAAIAAAAAAADILMFEQVATTTTTTAELKVAVTRRKQVRRTNMLVPPIRRPKSSDASADGDWMGDLYLVKQAKITAFSKAILTCGNASISSRRRRRRMKGVKKGRAEKGNLFTEQQQLSIPSSLYLVSKDDETFPLESVNPADVAGGKEKKSVVNWGKAAFFSPKCIYM